MPVSEPPCGSVHNGHGDHARSQRHQPTSDRTAVDGRPRSTGRSAPSPHPRGPRSRPVSPSGSKRKRPRPGIESPPAWSLRSTWTVATITRPRGGQGPAAQRATPALRPDRQRRQQPSHPSDRQRRRPGDVRHPEPVSGQQRRQRLRERPAGRNAGPVEVRSRAPPSGEIMRTGGRDRPPRRSVPGEPTRTRGRARVAPGIITADAAHPATTPAPDGQDDQADRAPRSEPDQVTRSPPSACPSPGHPRRWPPRARRAAASIAAAAVRPCRPRGELCHDRERGCSVTLRRHQPVECRCRRSERVHAPRCGPVGQCQHL